MSKWVISADWHIGNYSNYNYSPNSRLKQFPKVAERVIEIAKLNHSDTLLILGDFIDVPVNIPKVEVIIKQTLDILKGYFKKIYYIVGQHCKYSKSDHSEHDDTMLSMFDDNQFIYMHHQCITVDDHIFGFQDWTPTQDTNWIEGHLDVLFGHYTKSSLFGQDIDDSKFDLMIHGDIHNTQEIGKFISVCNPIQLDMKSEQSGCILIFDTETLKWERIRIDEDHTRFLRMDYTTDKSKEGFHGPLQYYIYKPEISVSNDEELTKTITWNDIDDLIQTVCKDQDVLDIHSEVESKCIPFSEVDFNFQLVYANIHGYRSIKDLRIDFKNHDRIALLGDNGSGKSSIVKAIQGVFLRNSYLKYEQSDFTDDMEITIGLVYQNKLFEITKGSRWRLVIDGQEQGYNNLTEFEKDLPIKLPFIEYLDLMFINSDVHNLSTQFNPTRRIELISKFYRLDRIGAYNSTAWNLYKDVEHQINELRSELNVVIGVKNHLIQRQSDLKEFATKSREELLEVIKHYQTIRDKYQLYQLWLRDDANIRGQLSDVESKVKDLEKKISFDIEQGQVDLNDLKKKAEQTNELYEKNYNDSIKFEKELKEIQQLEVRGSELNNKLDSLNKGICPECEAPLSQGKAKKLKDSYELELEELRKKWIELDDSLNSYPKQRESKEYFIKLLQNLKTAYNDLKQGIELVTNKINQYNISKSNYDEAVNNLKSIESKFESHKTKEPELIKLPLDMTDKELEASSNLSKYDEYQCGLKDIDNQNNKISELEDKISVLQSKLDKYNTYIEVTSNGGIIYEQILTQLADKFSSTDVKYEVDAGVYRGSRYINFNSYYSVKGTFRIYESCSDGQKIVCDLDFLSKLFSVNVGVLALDEYLKSLDEKNFPKACDILSEMNVNTLLLSTHDPNISIYTKRILVSLNDLGETQALIS